MYTLQKGLTITALTTRRYSTRRCSSWWGLHFIQCFYNHRFTVYPSHWTRDL